ncbi:MAG: hypothetical protein RIM83_00070, partial [Allomuricauda sp.]
MTRFLHFPTTDKSNMKTELPNVRFYLSLNKTLSILGLLIILLHSTSTIGQQVDTWFRAGKGINSPTNGIGLSNPNPITTLGQDGDQVTAWYDIVYYSEQNAVPHPDPLDYSLPYPDGFDYPFPNSGANPLYLEPIGSIPGLPTVRRNATDNINFNPVVNFDGSGDGQALHFRSNSRGDVTVFVVFKALGAGNSTETQRLLFGGDVDQHHLSFNPDDWTTNLSLGIAQNNHFSVGRSWEGNGAGNFYEGSIDLLGEPAIGAFTREAGVDSETFNTHVNGLADLSQMVNDPLADNDLFYFNKLGKHFNSNDPNRNLTGDIAEVILADFPMSDNLRQRVESYLAIKYGITLNAAGQLGSITGNDTYNYLAADGTTIWTVDPTYSFDIAGLGKDRYKDVLNSLSLRYDLDQRISKSVNTEAIVTMSTNSDFSTDNLDFTRTEIDAQITGAIDPYEHNYLLWGNDHASLNVTNVELPNPNTTVTERISREWRIQKTFSVGVNPIDNVSLRVDLSGSDIPLTDSCALYLMIDTDGDGDFTTGPITYINATSVIGTDVFFDNVTFEHQDVFTIGHGDLVPPTASNPTTIVVCDTVPAPDPNVVTDEADNCAVDTVEHIVGDVSDNNSNPETITRTYRVTDTSGNFIEVTHTIEVYTSPAADGPADVEACDSYQLPALTNGSYFDAPNGGGNALSAGDNITSTTT